MRPISAAHPLRRDLLRHVAVALATSTIGVFAFACSDSSNDTAAVPDSGGAPNDATVSDGGRDAASPDATVSSDSGTDASDAASASDASDASDANASTCTAVPCAIQIATGSEHACALLSDHTVKCWGSNWYGETGTANYMDGGAWDASTLPVPAAVSGLGPVKQIASGWYHVCALSMDGTVWCWGYGMYGQTARLDAGAKAFPVPAQVTGFSAAVDELVMGGYHSCARLAGGKLACWGLNNFGQVGVGSVLADAGMSVPEVNTPTDVSQVASVAQVAPGSRWTCTVADDGGVGCFGFNYSGMIGRADAGPDMTPHPDVAPVQGLDSPVAKFSKSQGYHTHVVMADGTVRGWGENGSQELGIGADAGLAVATATPVPNFDGVVDVSPGDAFTCAVRNDKTVWCWGRSDFGVGGLDPDSGAIIQATPRQIQGLANVVQLSSGWDGFACALVEGGEVKCWGSNEYSQLGRGLDAGVKRYDLTPQTVQF